MTTTAIDLAEQIIRLMRNGTRVPARVSKVADRVLVLKDGSPLDVELMQGFLESRGIVLNG